MYIVTIYLLFCVFVVTISSFQFGYNMGVLNAPQTVISGYPNQTECSDTPGFFKPCISMSKSQYGLLTSFMVLGCFVGALFSGPVSDLIGRRSLLFFTNFFFLIGSIICTIFSNYYSLVVGRFITGMGVGVVSVIVPVYLAEISPADYRGAIGAAHKLVVVAGIFISNLMGIFLSIRQLWRLLLALSALLAILQMSLILFCKESPRWLMSKGWESSAENALYWLNGDGNLAKEDTATMKASLDNGTGEKKSFGMTVKRYFRLQLLKQLLIGFGLHIAQQFSGINAVVFYSAKIFEEAKITNSILAASAVGLSNVVAAVLSLYLIEKWGRRNLLLGSELMALLPFCILAGTNILQYYGIRVNESISVICVISFVFGFAVGLGPIPWVMLAELYPNDVRGVCQGIVTCVNWVCTFIVAYTFPLISQDKRISFLPFVVFLVLSIMFTYLFVPETKGKSLDEIK